MKVKIVGKKLEIIEEEEINTGDLNIDFVEFIIEDEKYKDLIKVAVFVKNEQVLNVVLDEQNIAKVPNEFLINKGFLYIGLYMYEMAYDHIFNNEDLNLRYSFEPCFIEIKNGSYIKCDTIPDIPLPDLSKFLTADNIIAGENVKIIRIGNNVTISASGGTTPVGDNDYNNLEHLPKLNNITIQGNKTAEDYGIQEMTTEEREKLASLENYDDTQIKQDLQTLNVDINNTNDRIDDLKYLQGKNVFDFNKLYEERNQISANTGTIELTEEAILYKDNPSTASQYFPAHEVANKNLYGFENLKPSTTYTISFYSIANCQVWLFYFDKNNTRTQINQSFTGEGKHEFTFTTPSTLNWYSVRLDNRSVGDNKIYDIQIEENNTATNFEEYYNFIGNLDKKIETKANKTEEIKVIGWTSIIPNEFQELDLNSYFEQGKHKFTILVYIRKDSNRQAVKFELTTSELNKLISKGLASLNNTLVITRSCQGISNINKIAMLRQTMKKTETDGIIQLKYEIYEDGVSQSGLNNFEFCMYAE